MTEFAHLALGVEDPGASLTFCREVRRLGWPYLSSVAAEIASGEAAAEVPQFCE